ncbi:MAG: hypothetical protein LBT69_02875 [Lactobacillales bacterium]|jgi:hypothetical protein|nr:hypothetical protein [Lactobacillales bacterium]
MKIFKFFYILNKNKYLKNHLIVQQFPKMIQAHAFLLITIFKFSVVCFSAFVINFFLYKQNIEVEYLGIIQSILSVILFCAFSKQAKNSDQGLNSLLFLLGGTFNRKEKRTNIKLIAIYYSIASLLYLLLFNFFFTMLFNKEMELLHRIILLITPVILFITVYLSVSADVFCERKINVPFYFKFPLMLMCYFIVIYGMEIFNSLEFCLKNNFSHETFLIMLIYCITMIFLFIIYPLKKRIKQTKSGYFVSGLFKNYFIENIENSMFLVFIASLLIRFLLISEISKVLIAVLITIFLLTPNLANFKMISYIKILGKCNIFSKKYSIKIFQYTIPLLILFLLLAGINRLSFLLLSIFIFGAVLAIKHYIFITIMNLGHSDNKKIDYTIFLNFVILGILAILAINIR